MDRAELDGKYRDAIRRSWEWADTSKERVKKLPDDSYDRDFDGASVALENAQAELRKAENILQEIMDLEGHEC